MLHIVQCGDSGVLFHFCSDLFADELHADVVEWRLSVLQGPSRHVARYAVVRVCLFATCNLLCDCQDIRNEEGT